MYRLTVILLFFTCNIISQEITGKIYYKGNPVDNADILVANSSISTKSDEDGRFIIKAKKGDLIIFSHEGMQTKQFRIKNFNPIEINLDPEVNTLEEVEITTGKNKVNKPESFKSAIGKINTRGAGYAVHSLTTKDIQNSIMDLPQALVGRIPNYTLTPRGAILRGRGFQTAYAIWDIDGIVFEGIPPFVNPEYVESIHVITNPAGTLQYGKRGRGGVIVVNTAKNLIKNKRRKNYPQLNVLQQKDIELPYDDNELSQIIKRIQTNTDSLRLLAFAYDNKGNSKTALKLNRLILANNLDNIRPYRDVAESLIKIGKKNRAWNLYNFLLNSKGDSIDEVSFDVMFNDMERLFHVYNMDRDPSNTFVPRKNTIKNYKAETRVVFEWSLPNEALSIEVINPKNETTKFQLGNSFIENSTVEHVFIDETIKGDWVLNLSISEMEELNGYLKVTIYRNWISLNKTPPESKIYLLSDELSGATYKLLDLKI